MLKKISTEQFELPNTNGRMVHCATVTNTRTLKDYIYIYDVTTKKKYVEDFTGCKLKQIEDDNEWEEMRQYGIDHDLWPFVILK